MFSRYFLSNAFIFLPSDAFIVHVSDSNITVGNHKPFLDWLLHFYRHCLIVFSPHNFLTQTPPPTSYFASIMLSMVRFSLYSPNKYINFALSFPFGLTSLSFQFKNYYFPPSKFIFKPTLSHALPNILITCSSPFDSLFCSPILAYSTLIPY